MRTSFNPQLQYDPTSGGLSGATPWGAIIQGGVGLAQTIGGLIQKHKALKELNNLQSPTYTPNKSISDYYSTALQRYNVNPYQSTQYQNATNQSGRTTAGLLSDIKGRGGSVAAVGKLAAMQNDAGIKAGVAAENEQNQRFGALGGAANAKAAEEGKAFQINQMMPFERKYNLLSAKAGGGANIMNAGLSNIFGAGDNISQMAMLKKYYGEDSGNRGAKSSSYDPTSSPYWQQRTRTQ
jgi:hypothetical protein